MVTTHLEPLFQALDDGALLLTVNRRLAGHLRRAYDGRQQAAGLAVWATPEILPYGAWLNRCWSEGREALHDTGTGTGTGAAGSGTPALSHATLLSPPQAEVLWERVIAESPEAARILHPLGTARLAAEAWEILQRWRLEPPRDDGALSAESGAFARWSARFVEICLESGWTDPSRMPETVSAWFRDGVLPPPPRIVHTGFDEIVPQQAALFDLLAGMGTDVSQHTLPDTRGESFRTGLPDEDAEIEAAARWARHILEQGRLEPQSARAQSAGAQPAGSGRCGGDDRHRRAGPERPPGADRTDIRRCPRARSAGRIGPHRETFQYFTGTAPGRCAHRARRPRSPATVGAESPPGLHRPLAALALSGGRRG
ncbi:MAG: hypothetical protein IID61_11805 [SAR324 cluster bacterium]|nr:hypothetical protein [SAR324 cluster bacterium]